MRIPYHLPRSRRGHLLSSQVESEAKSVGRGWPCLCKSEQSIKHISLRKSSAEQSIKHMYSEPSSRGKLDVPTPKHATGVHRLQEDATPLDPNIGLCLGSLGGGCFLVGGVFLCSDRFSASTRHLR